MPRWPWRVLILGKGVATENTQGVEAAEGEPSEQRARISRHGRDGVDPMRRGWPAPDSTGLHCVEVLPTTFTFLLLLSKSTI